MWLFLSSRIRTWLLLAVAVPVVRRLVHAAAVRADRNDPGARSARLLVRADRTLGAYARRRR